MEVNFTHIPAKPVEPIYIEQVFAEKPGGGVVANPTFDVPPTTAVGQSGDQFVAIKAYKLHTAAAGSDTKIKIAKGSGVATGDIIATGKKGVACTAVDTSNDAYDEVTVTLGVEVKEGAVLYQAKAASTSAEPIVVPEYVTGNWVHADKGDQLVRLINGANLRKETANIAPEVAALLPTIKLV